MSDWRSELAETMRQENPAHEERKRQAEEATERTAQHRLLVEHYLTQVVDSAFKAVSGELGQDQMHHRRVVVSTPVNAANTMSRAFEASALSGRRLRVTFSASYDAARTYASLDIEQPGTIAGQGDRIDLSLSEGSRGYMDEEALCRLLASEYSKLIASK